MKKIFLLLAPFIIISCTNDDTTKSESETTNVLARLIPNMETVFDAELSLTSHRTKSPWSNDINKANFNIASNFSDHGNIGEMYLNEVILDKDYNKFYDSKNVANMYLDYSSLFGNEIHVQNINCRGSDFCDIDYKFITSPGLDFEIDGLTNTNEINGSSLLTIKWNSQNNNNDYMGLMVSKLVSTEIGKSNIELIKTFTNNDQFVTVSGNELSSLFSDNEDLVFTLVRGNQYVYTKSTNKIAFYAADIVSYGGLKFKK